MLTDNLDFSSSSYWIALETTTARVDATATAAMITGSDLPVGVELLVAAVVFGVSGYLLFARRSQLWGSENADAAVVLICVATLTGVYHSFYDLVLLVLPVLLVTRRDFAGGHVTSTVRYALLGALLVAAFNPFRFGPIVDILDESDRMLRLLSPGITGLAVVVALGFAWYTMRAIPVSDHSVHTESD